MTFSVHGLAVSRGIAIGRAVLVASSRADVAHYFIDADKIEDEIIRVRTARNAVIQEITRVQKDLPRDAPPELAALLDVQLLMLQDELLISGVKHWITDRHYNGEWALNTQYEILARQFDDMEDEYLRERKADLEQVVERILRTMRGAASPLQPAVPAGSGRNPAQGWLLDDTVDVPLVLIAHDISPADMMQFKQSLFAGFATDVGGKTSHTAIVARSLSIPAVVGARSASVCRISEPCASMGISRLTCPCAAARKIARNCVRNIGGSARLQRMARKPSAGFKCVSCAFSIRSALRSNGLSEPMSTVRIVTGKPCMPSIAAL